MSAISNQRLSMVEIAARAAVKSVGGNRDVCLSDGCIDKRLVPVPLRWRLPIPKDR
jgi:hypothetical protein